MVRIDMSEYMEKFSVSRLVGAPPGYVGYEEGGQLTERVRRRPFSVLLLDELEKAHADVYPILLSVLEDGILCDSAGRRVDFSNTIIIMTSNLGSGADKKHTLGFADQEKARRTQAIQEKLRTHLHPEFLDRIDEVVVFSPLSKESLCHIATRMLDDMVTRCSYLGFTLTYEKSIPDYLANLVSFKNDGARPLRREITRCIEDPLSDLLIRTPPTQGSVLHMSLIEDHITFGVAEPVPTL